MRRGQGAGIGGVELGGRSAERGVDVTLIERGKRWASGERDAFATFAKPDRRVSWLSDTNAAAGALYPSDPWKPYTGLMERIPGDGMDVVCAAGVGGGSLPYHGMTLQPRGDLFDQVMPDQLDYEEFDERWYPLVRKALRATPIPDDVLVMATIAIGKPEGRHGPVRRRPVGELVFDGAWDRAPDWAGEPPGTRHTGRPPR